MPGVRPGNHVSHLVTTSSALSGPLAGWFLVARSPDRSADKIF
jgi:hypothetical protein